MPKIKDMEVKYKPSLTCRACGHSGDDYKIALRGVHNSCFCAKCDTWIKHIAHDTKYRTVEKLEVVARKTQGLCGYCGCQLGSGATVDHIDPQANGGSHHPTNLLAACKSCNSRKGKKSLEQYRGYLLRTTGKRTVFYFEEISDITSFL